MQARPRSFVGVGRASVDLWIGRQTQTYPIQNKQAANKIKFAHCRRQDSLKTSDGFPGTLPQGEPVSLAAHRVTQGEPVSLSRHRVSRCHSPQLSIALSRCNRAAIQSHESTLRASAWLRAVTMSVTTCCVFLTKSHRCKMPSEQSSAAVWATQTHPVCRYF